MVQPGIDSLRKIAVIGRGTAGSLAAANVTRLHTDNEYELHHIHDSRIPVIGVGEGSWPNLVQELTRLTNLSDETVQMRVKGTRKYGIEYEGWGLFDRDFTHHFLPRDMSYAYHLSADLMGDMLHESTNARHIDAKVLNITKVDGGAQVDFEGLPPERYDLVFDARGFPKALHPDQHIDIAFIPTNTAVIRRCPPIIQEPKGGPALQHTYTRSVARPHGWIFVIPLTVHTSYGYIFNRDISDITEVESDFDEFLSREGVKEYEQRAVIRFPNFVHRQMYDGAVARIGNAGAFMEPLEATAIVSAQLQIGMVIQTRLQRPLEHLERDAPAVNRFLVNTILCYGLFVGWHYSCGSIYDTEFWCHAREHVWPQHRKAVDPGLVDCDALKRFDEMIELINQSVIDDDEWNRKCGFSVSSYLQMSEGLGYSPPMWEYLAERMSTMSSGLNLPTIP